MNEVLKRLWRAEEGQDLVEYSMLVLFLELGAVGGMVLWCIRAAAHSS